MRARRNALTPEAVIAADHLAARAAAKGDYCKSGSGCCCFTALEGP